MTITKNGTISHMNKLIWGIIGTLTATIGSPMPQLLRTLTWCIVVMTLADTLVGFYVAARFREVQSRKFLEKLTDKSVLFLIVALVGFMGSIMLQNWTPSVLVASGVIAYEVLSIIESGKRLARRESQGKILIRILDKIGKIFADNADGTGVTVEQTDTRTQKTTVTTTPHVEGKP